jgi:hypothetical protein
MIYEMVCLESTESGQRQPKVELQVGGPMQVHVKLSMVGYGSNIVNYVDVGDVSRPGF